MSADLIIEEREDVLWVRIDRAARRNAPSRAVLAELGVAFGAHAGDQTLKAAVLTAAGDKAFAAGGDLREFAEIVSEDAAAELFRSVTHARGRTYASMGREIHAQPGGVAFQILDAKIREMNLYLPNYRKATTAKADTLEKLAEVCIGLGHDVGRDVRASCRHRREHRSRSVALTVRLPRKQLAR